MPVLLLLALVLGGLRPTPTPPATRTLIVAVRDLAGEPVPGVTLEVTGATVPAGITDAGGVVRFAVLEDALTIVAAYQDGRTLLLDRTSPAGLRVPLGNGPVTLELWLSGDQLFVPPAGDGPIPVEVAQLDAEPTLASTPTAAQAVTALVGNTPASIPTVAQAVTTPTLPPLDVDPPLPLPTMEDYAQEFLHQLRTLLVLMLGVVLLPFVLLLALALLAWTVHRHVRRKPS